ncbi:hypothetical protein ACTHOQ_09405 [Solibacillus silvestris]|uniref:hypothetical protein n=1 Tax=Solibacillus silvestris TaxID=76853 RepID=UPI003F808264
MRKPKFKKERIDVPSVLRIEHQQSKRVMQDYSCGHCGFRYCDQVDTKSKLCRTVVCAVCKERSSIYLDPNSKETKQALRMLEVVLKLNKVFKALRWFNPEKSYRTKS